MKDLKNLSDEDLVLYVCDKEKEAYRLVVERYQGKLLRYVGSLVGDEEKADDIVQETFIKAYVNLRSFNTKRKFSSWIYRIAHNEAINYLKKYRKETKLSDKQAEKLIGTSNVEEELERKEAVKMLRKCIKKLPLMYRSVLVLYYLEDYSYEEIGDILRIPTGTVGTRLGRGKRMLTKECSKLGGEKYV
ncbi:RNA polymerase sigma factor [Patescibacteria group bacterium]